MLTSSTKTVIVTVVFSYLVKNIGQSGVGYGGMTPLRFC